LRKQYLEPGRRIFSEKRNHLYGSNLRPGFDARYYLPGTGGLEQLRSGDEICQSGLSTGDISVGINRPGTRYFKKKNPIKGRMPGKLLYLALL